MTGPAPIWSPAELDAMAGLIRTLLDSPAAGPLTAPPLELVRRHHLGPLAHGLGLAGFRDDYAATAIAAARRAATLAEVGAALAAAGIAIAPIKGAALIGELYPDAAHRPMLDVDVLVRLAERERAADVLRGLGFDRVGATRKLSHLAHALAMARHGEIIELHRSIMQVGRTRLDLDAMWRRARPRPGSAMLHLDPVDQVLVVALHVARHELYVPALAYVDVHRGLARLPPTERSMLRERAAAYRVSRPLAAVLAMLEVLRAGGSGRPAEPRPRRLMPRAIDVVAARRPARGPQLVHKLALTEGPREALGLATAWIAAYLDGCYRER